MSYQGAYINLDRSTERRAHMEAELQRFGLLERYLRLPGVDGNPDQIASPLKNAGEIGCFLSHVKALQQAKAGTHLHIIEDDTLFAACTAPTLDWAVNAGILDGFDLMYTDVAMPLSNESYRQFKNMFDACVTRDAAGNINAAQFQAIDLGDIDFMTTSSYMVNHRSFGKLMDLYQAEVAAGLRLPIDMFFRNYAKIGGLKVGCLFPFITSARVDDTITSTVRQNPDSTRKFTAANIGRYTFFIGCDWVECERLMQRHIAPPPAGDRHLDTLSRLLAFSLTLKD